METYLTRVKAVLDEAALSLPDEEYEELLDAVSEDLDDRERTATEEFDAGIDDE